MGMPTPRLTPEAADLFLELVDAWESDERHGQRGPIMVTQWNSPAGARLTHPGLARERRVRFGELEALEQATVISIRRTGQNRGLIDITDSGLAYAAQLRQARKDTDRTALSDMDWETTMRPVLRAVYEASLAATPFGVGQAEVNALLGRPADDPKTDRLLHELERNGYIEAATPPVGEAWGPTHSRLTEKGLQVVAAWPGAASDDVVLRLLDVLNAEIERTDDPDRKSKLEKLRDGVAGIGRDVLTDVLSKVLTGQA
jgi:DNA-binding PadR family transcriptional regulator